MCRIAIALAVLVVSASLLGAKKKNPDDITETLALPKDPPAVAVGETRRLVFHISPLSAKGLLSQQTRDALKAVLKLNGNQPIVHIRAFVAGSGDLRRVPQIVSEVFTEKKMALPSVSVIHAGALALENAQVVLETISLAKKETNPDGIAYLSGAAPEFAGALDQIAAQAKGVTPMVITCFTSKTDGLAELVSLAATRFPGAAVDVVSPLLAPARAGADCEAVSRGSAITAARLAFSGTQGAFGSDEKAAKLAFERLQRDLTEAGADATNIAWTDIYVAQQQIGDLVRMVSPLHGPTRLRFVEGVVSNDASFAVDAVAPVNQDAVTRK